MPKLPSSLPFVFSACLFAQSPTAPLVGTVLDPEGKPVASANVRVARCDGRLFRCLDLALRNEWIDVARTKTDKAGRFGLQVPLGLALRVEVDVPPFARWISESVVPGENQTVQLEAACMVEGQCVDAATGQGTPCALRAWNKHTRVDLFAGRTDAEGRFRFERLPSGAYTCDIDPDVAMRPRWSDSSLAPGEVQRNEWKCDPGVELTGTVTDASTGEPIAGARIGEGWTFDKAVRSDAAGRYTMQGFGDPHNNFVYVHADAPGYSVQDTHCDWPGEKRRLDFALHRGVRVVGRVITPDGVPIANAYVAAIGATSTTNIPWQACRTRDDGEFVCDGFPRGTDGMLMVRCVGFSSVVYNLPRAASDGQIDFGSVKLQPPNIVRGSVRNADGTPVAGAEVCLQGVNADVAWLGAQPSAWWLLRNYAGERQVRTDANGAFAFGDVAAGEYTLSLGSMTTLAPEAAQVTVTAGKELQPITITR